MPKPKLISFSKATPEVSEEQPVPASEEIFNVKKSTKKCLR